MTITTLPPAPSRQSPTTFSDDADAFLSALPTFGDEANALAVEMDANLAASEASLGAIDWAEMYLGSKPSDPTLDNSGEVLQEGALYFNSTNSIMRVYNGASWQDASSSVNGTANRYSYIATEGQTTFAAVYDAGYVDVYVNGIRLISSDFTATDTTTVILNEGVSAGTSVDLIGYGNFMFDMAVPTLSAGKFLTNDGADLSWGNPLPCAQIADASAGSETYTFNYLGGDMQRLTATDDITIAFSNFTTGKVVTFVIEAVNWGDYYITHPGTMLFAAGVAPQYTSGGVDQLLIIKDKDEVFTLHVVGQALAVVA